MAIKIVQTIKAYFESEPPTFIDKQISQDYQFLNENTVHLSTDALSLPLGVPPLKRSSPVIHRKLSPKGHKRLGRSASDAPALGRRESRLTRSTSEGNVIDGDEAQTKKGSENRQFRKLSGTRHIIYECPILFDATWYY